MRQYKLDIAFKDMKKFYKQFTVNYLLNPEKWTLPKVNTERSQMNNRANANRYTSRPLGWQESNNTKVLQTTD